MQKNLPIIIEKTFQTSVGKVWKALTDKEQMKCWYFTIEDFKLEKDAAFSFYEPGDTKQFYHRCVIREIIPNKKFQHSWEHPNHSKGESLLTWILEQLPEGTKVILIHEGLENFSDAGADFARENYVAGWEEIVGASLKAFLEE